MAASIQIRQTTTSWGNESMEQVACKLHVRHIPARFVDVDVYRMFSPYGIIQDIRMPPVQSATMNFRYAFVTFARQAMADAAMRALDGQTRIENDFCNVVLTTPLRVEVYLPHGSHIPTRPPREQNSNNKQIVSPLKGVNENEQKLAMPKPLLDLKSMSLLDAENQRPPPAPLITMASKFGQNAQLNVRNNSTKPAGAPSSVVSSTIPPQVNEVYVYSRAKLPTDAKGAVCNMHKLLICLQEIVLASMNSPFDIHVRLASKYAEYVAMMQSLQQYYSKEKKLSTRLFDPSTLVAVQCADKDSVMKWYRGWITAVEAPTIKTSQINQCRYYCTLVDTGERVCVVHTNVRQLVKHFHYEPFQAISCCLYNVVPLNNANEFDATVTDLCRDWLNNENMNIRAICVSPTKSCATSSNVDVVNMQKQFVRFVGDAGAFAATEGEDLSQLLISEQLAAKCVLTVVPVGVTRPALHYYERDLMLLCRQKCGDGEKFATLAKEFSELFVV